MRDDDCARRVPPRLDEGGLGRALLFIGKLPRRDAEVLVLDVAGEVLARIPGHHDAAATAVARLPPELEVPSKQFVEQDLSIEDCMADGAEALPAVFVPGRRSSRRMMEARAQQCVVCLAEKEHTLVPPHRCDSDSDGEASPQDLPYRASSVAAVEARAARRAARRRQVEGHRFCTDCWAEFLRHGVVHRPKTQGAAEPRRLACPVCRGAICVPDVWGVRLGLSPRRAAPAAWRCRPRDGWGASPAPARPQQPHDRTATVAPPATSGVDANAAVEGPQPEEAPPEFWAFRRARAGDAFLEKEPWQPRALAHTGSSFCGAGGHATEGLVMCEATCPLDARVTPHHSLPRSNSMDWWWLAINVLLYGIGCILVLREAAALAMSMKSDEDPGLLGLLLDHWPLNAGLTTDCRRDGYSD